ncbi:MAG: hypothetical protein NDJ94_07100 [Vicinamibacteria bacterium]|nr:hypothetical protein [Vicinamibacteria bacterium]
MKTRVPSRGPIRLPTEFRCLDRLEAAPAFDRPNLGLVDWLLACPHKGFFEEIPSESTDSL